MDLQLRAARACCAASNCYRAGLCVFGRVELASSFAHSVGPVWLSHAVKVLLGMNIHSRSNGVPPLCELLSLHCDCGIRVPPHAPDGRTDVGSLQQLQRCLQVHGAVLGRCCCRLRFDTLVALLMIYT